jgi:hypothetical protein
MNMYDKAIQLFNDAVLAQGAAANESFTEVDVSTASCPLLTHDLHAAGAFLKGC